MTGTRRKLFIGCLGGASIVAVSLFGFLGMPGRSHRGALPPLGDAQRSLAEELARDVMHLAGKIGERNFVRHAELDAAATAIASELAEHGYSPQREPFPARSIECANVWCETRGSSASPQIANEIVLVGAHYDSVLHCPGANDNASGVAALLALARRFARTKHERTLRFVAFVNEEPPWFQTDAMGSLVHARGCKQRGENVVAMYSLETLGCYSDDEGSQHYPLGAFALVYPSQGNFVAFVGNVASRALVRRSIASFRASAAFPSEGTALPAFVPGIGWSDQWAFWEQGYRALMVTDTAPFRFAQYHTPHDTPERVDCERLARVVEGLAAVIAGELDR